MVLLPHTQALAAFGDKVSKQVYVEAADLLIKRIRAEQKTGTLFNYALSLGVLRGKATAAQFEEASVLIVPRFAAARDMQDQSALAGAIEAVADVLEEPVAERLSGSLVERMVNEHDPGSLLHVAVGLESIADEAKGPGAAALVARLTDRMRKEESAFALRGLAFSAAAFTNTPGNLDATADILVRRMDDENEPDDLRNLASGLYALRLKAGSPAFEKAASILASRIETQMNPSEIRELAICLHALESKASSQPFDRAASAIVRNPKNLAELEASLRMLGGKVSSTKAAELSAILTTRVAGEQDQGNRRVLEMELTDLPGHATPMIEIFDPLCPENTWFDLAARALHMTPAAANDIPPDFAQLADDDDDDAGNAPPDKGPLDFHRLSDAVSGLRPALSSARAPLSIQPGAVFMIAGFVAVIASLVMKRYRAVGSGRSV